MSYYLHLFPFRVHPLILFSSLYLLVQYFSWRVRQRQTKITLVYTYRTSCNKRRASNKGRPLISAAPLGIHIEISASPLTSTAPLNAALITYLLAFSMLTLLLLFSLLNFLLLAYYLPSFLTFSTLNKLYYAKVYSNYTVWIKSKERKVDVYVYL